MIYRWIYLFILILVSRLLRLDLNFDRWSRYPHWLIFDLFLFVFLLLFFRSLTFRFPRCSLLSECFVLACLLFHFNDFFFYFLKYLLVFLWCENGVNWLVFFLSCFLYFFIKSFCIKKALTSFNVGICWVFIGSAIAHHSFLDVHFLLTHEVFLPSVSHVQDLYCVSY